MFIFTKHSLPPFYQVMGDQQWYKDFVSDSNMPEPMLFEVLTAANYMEIQPLLDLTVLVVTFKLQGKTAEEVCISSRDCSLG